MERDNKAPFQIQKDTMYAFYVREDEPSVFFAGRVVQWEQNGDILVRLTAPDGTSDGFLLFPIAYAYRVERDSIYLRQLEKTEIGKNIITSRRAAWDTLLNYAQEQKIAVQLRDQKWKCITRGFVVDFTSQNVVVQRIKKSGMLGQSRSFRKENICFLFCGSDSEIALMRQYQEAQNAN